MSLFKKNKNRNKVENPYYLLGLLQQTMIIRRWWSEEWSDDDHCDLSVVYQAQASLGTS